MWRFIRIWLFLKEYGERNERSKKLLIVKPGLRIIFLSPYSLGFDENHINPHSCHIRSPFLKQKYVFLNEILQKHTFLKKSYTKIIANPDSEHSYCHWQVSVAIFVLFFVVWFVVRPLMSLRGRLSLMFRCYAPCRLPPKILQSIFHFFGMGDLQKTFVVARVFGTIWVPRKWARNCGQSIGLSKKGRPENGHESRTRFFTFW